MTVFEEEEKEDEQMSLKAAVCKAFDELAKGEKFYGHQIKERVAELRPKSAHCYIETVLRKLRLYRRFDYECIDIRHGQYIKV